MTISASERAVAALFIRQPGARAVECRSTRFVFIEYNCRPFPWRFGSRESSNAENDNWAISVCDICTVVSGGAMNWASLMSSNPTTDKSRGILRPRSNAARITPTAVISFEQSTAEGRSGMAARTGQPFHAGFNRMIPIDEQFRNEALNRSPPCIFQPQICVSWRFSSLFGRR